MLRFLKLPSTTSGIALAFFILSASAYSPHYTHPDLTEEMIKFYNSSAQGKKIGSEFVTPMRQGSIDEDTAPRWINHFYDPQSGEGWTGEHLGPHDKEVVQKASQAILAIGFTPMVAPLWAEDQHAQNLFISYGGNHTWQKAIYDYAHGDEKRALETLGYILHLIEDMSVPDHTRNDSHPHVAGDPGSPYEEWVKEYTNSHKLDTAEVLINNKNAIPNFSNLKEAFDYIARYSNENFFSEETVSDRKYIKPEVEKVESIVTPQGEIKYLFGRDKESGSEYLLAFARKSTDGIVYTLIGENQTLLLDGYFKYLSRRSVLAGAGVIDLFFREVEKAKENPELLETPPPLPNSLGTIGTYFYTRVVSPYGAISAFTEPIADVVRAIKKTPLRLQEQMDAFKKSIFNVASALYGSSVTLDELENSESPSPEARLVPEDRKEAIAPDISEKLASRGTSGNSTSENTRNPFVSSAPTGSRSSNTGVAAVVALIENVVAAVPRFIPSLTPDPATIGDGFRFNGGGLPPGAGAAPANDAQTQPSSVQINQSSGSSPPNSNQQEDSDDDSQENSEEEQEPLDVTSPDIAFSISECNTVSIANNGCLLLNSAIHLSWSSTATDTDHFEITCSADNAPCIEFSLLPTTATSTEYVLTKENKALTFAAKSVDAAGNKSDAITKTVEFSAMPVVVNEIAWMGTGSSNTANKDEWVELYNKTTHEINLSSWSLVFYASGTTTPSHLIDLSGNIPSKGFYLVERTDDNAVADVASDLTSSFGSSGLLNTGMIVELEHGGTVIDRTPNLCSSAWCGGSSSSYATMERDDPFTDGSEQSNWGTQSDLGANIKNGTNVEGGVINGTPKQRNSRNYLIAPNSLLTQSEILTKTNSPYIIPSNSTLSVGAGATLTVEPGVIIKFAGSAGMKVNGRLTAMGNADNRIIFTSIHDDTNGGDTNQNNASTAPAPADWTMIRFINTIDASQLDYVTVRYGGTSCGFACPPVEDLSMLFFSGGPMEVRRSIVEYSYTSGIWAKNASGAITDTIFQNLYSSPQGDCRCALGLSGGGITVQSNTFKNSNVGVYVVSGNHGISKNVFTNNSGDAIRFEGGTPSFNGNTASGNAQNGIVMLSEVAADYTFEKDLPYIGGPSVANGKTVTVKPGVVFKNTSTQSIRGILKAEGSTSDPIVFTSLKDDTYGGDTNNDGVCNSGNASPTTSCPNSGDWPTIKFFSGASGSFLKHTLTRYGGSCNFCGGSPNAAFLVSGSAIEIANSIFEKNKAIGLWLVHSATTTVTSTIIRDHKSIDLAEGIRLENSHVILDGVAFSENSKAITGDSASSATLGAGGVTFFGNTTDDTPATLIP